MMRAHFAAEIEPTDRDYWSGCFPRGLGGSAFSSPVWQRLMAEQVDEGWQPRLLRAKGPEGFLSIPVFAREGGLGRYDLAVHPVAYYVTPVEKAVLTDAELRAVLDVLCTHRVRHFTWWLPPWSTAHAGLTTRYRGLGRLTVGSVDTYVITLEGTAEQHIADRVSTTHRRYVRKNAKQGVHIVTDPDRALRDRYYALYQRVYEDRNWVGERFPRSMFDGVANDLDRGGQLAVAVHEGRVVGGGVLLYDHYAVHYFQGVLDRDAEGIHPHVALYEFALRQAEQRGLHRVNLGGVNEGNEGLARFKMAWGAEPVAVPILKWQSGPRVLLQRVRERAGSSSRSRR